MATGTLDVRIRLDASMAISQLVAAQVAVLSQVLKRNATMYRLHVQCMLLERLAREIGGA